MVVDNVRGDLLGCVASMYKGSVVEQCGFLVARALLGIGTPYLWDWDGDGDLGAK